MTLPRLPFRDDKTFSFLMLLVLAVPLSFVPGLRESYETVKLVLTLALLACALLVFVSGRKQAALRLEGHRLFFIVLAMFGGWAFLSAVLAPDKLYSFFGFYYRFTNGFLFYLAFAVFIILLLWNLTREKLIFLLKVLSADGLLISILAIFQSFGIAYYLGLDTTGLLRSPSTLGNPDFVAMFLAALLPLMLFLWRQASSRGEKIYHGATFLITLTALFLLSSRGAILGIAIGCLFALFLIIKRSGFKKPAVAAGIVILLLAGAAYFFNIARPGFFSASLGETQRMEAWGVTTREIFKHPVFGVGLGNFALAFEKDRGPDLAGSGGVFDDPHNLPLFLAATGGLPLAAAFLLLVGLGCWYGAGDFLRDGDLLPAALSVSVLVLLAASCFNPTSIPNYILLGLLLAGLIMPHRTWAAKPRGLFLKTAAYVLAAAFLVCAAGLLSGEILFAAGYRQYYNGNFSAAKKDLGAAESVNPTNELYYAYYAASLIQLSYPEGATGQAIAAIPKLHKTEAYSYVLASNLWDIRFGLTGQPGFLNQAVSLLKQSFRYDNLTVERYSQMAFYYYQLGNLSAARASVNYALRYLPDDKFSSLLLLAKIDQQEGLRDQTIFELNQAYAENPDPRLQVLLNIASSTPDIQNVPLQIQVVPGKVE